MEIPKRRGTPAQGKGYGLKSSVWKHIVAVYPSFDRAAYHAQRHEYDGYPVEIVEMVCVEVTK